MRLDVKRVLLDLFILAMLIGCLFLFVGGVTWLEYKTGITKSPSHWGSSECMPPVPKSAYRFNHLIFTHYKARVGE